MKVGVEYDHKESSKDSRKEVHVRSAWGVLWLACCIGAGWAAWASAVHSHDQQLAQGEAVYLPAMSYPITLTPSRTATVTVTASPTATITPTVTPTHTPIPTEPPSPTRNPAVCAPEYPTVCIPPPPPDLDCGDISFRRFRVLPPDRHRFDTDGDGIGCESR